MKISRNILLASTALLLALLAVLVGTNSTNSDLNYIYPEQLADSIISRSTDLLIIDLRSRKDFSDYHIFNSVNAGMESPLNLKENRFIVIISDNIRQARDFVGKEKINNYYLLNGGINSWKDKILFPRLNNSLKENSPELFRKKERVSRYFGGQPDYQNLSESKKIYRREGC